MRKGTTGLTLAAYATLAFVLAICNQTLLCALLLGFVLLVEKDEWLSKQIIQAFLLCIAYSFVANCLDIFSLLTAIPFIGGLFSGIMTALLSLISFICLVLGLLAITRVIKGVDAKLPLFSKFATWAFGVGQAIAPTVAPAPTATTTTTEGTTKTE